MVKSPPYLTLYPNYRREAELKSLPIDWISNQLWTCRVNQVHIVIYITQLNYFSASERHILQVLFLFNQLGEETRRFTPVARVWICAIGLGFVSSFGFGFELNAAETAEVDLEPRKTLEIVALGDSLTAGYGLPAGAGFVPQLQAALIKSGLKLRVTNAGVSGDTTAGGLSRLEWSVPDSADGVLLALGGNDALRALPPATTEDNLNKIIMKLTARGQKVMLIGMLAPPNLGKSYGEKFNRIYPRLAKQHNLVFYSFFLDGVAGSPSFNLDDGIHPNPDGIQEVVRRILPTMKDFIQDLN